MKQQLRGLSLVLGCAIALGAGGCARQQGPQVASSATQSSYAVSFPGELEATSQRLAATQTVARAAMRDFATFPDKLKTKDAAYVERLYELANAEGRSESYAQGFADALVVDAFFTREKQPLSGRVSAANEQAVEKAGGSKVELYGPTSYSLERGVAQSLEDELKERSDAQNNIEQNKRKLGPHDAATLSTQVQQISMASHAVFVGLPIQKGRAERLLSQVSDVENTLQARSEELQKVDTKGLNYEEKRWLSEEIASVNKARTQLAQTKQTAEQTLKQVEDQSATLQKDYDKAFEALLEAVRTKLQKQ
jgi:hypothetical protein